MTSEGPPATTSAGMPFKGQFSILMICRALHSASSYGRTWRLSLSLRYSCSNDSILPKKKRDEHVNSHLNQYCDKCFFFPFITTKFDD